MIYEDHLNKRKINSKSLTTYIFSFHYLDWLEKKCEKIAIKYVTRAITCGYTRMRGKQELKLDRPCTYSKAETKKQSLFCLSTTLQTLILKIAYVILITKWRIHALLNPGAYLLKATIKLKKPEEATSQDHIVNFPDILAASMCWRCSAAKSPCQVSLGPPTTWKSRSFFCFL